jgi:uncharacterized repeat protein (TIGR03837 family)
MASMLRQWDIFCRVVDNFGDIGVCWRLARQLAAEHGLDVRLWVDDLASLRLLCPETDAGLPVQHLESVEVRRWQADFTADRAADVVIEAFACDLPAEYITRMLAATPRPVWINLEYLTAEDWAEGCHGLASPHPTLPLVKHFFFPGFTERSGGLLREKEMTRTIRDRPPTGPIPTATEISLFCYETAPVGGLLEGIAAVGAPVRLHVAPGKPLAAVRQVLAGEGPWRVGQAEILPFPFLRPEAFDALLARCDINFVRGEDSFVRAQWAGAPFIWQAYPQADAAHQDKLRAFLTRYLDGCATPSAEAAVDAFTAWNLGSDVAFRVAWPSFFAARAQLGEHTRHWARRLAGLPDLASELVRFSRLRL